MNSPFTIHHSPFTIHHWPNFAFFFFKNQLIKLCQRYVPVLSVFLTFFIFIILYFTLLADSAAAAPKTKSKAIAEKTYRAKIVIFPFVNLSKSANYTYLSGSISSSLGTSIAALKRFDVVDETTAESAAKTLGFASLENLNKGQTLKLTKALGADIYITGSFLAIKDQIQIFGQIQNGKTGHNMGGSKEIGKLDSSLFTSLDKFAEGLAASLDKVVPRDKIIYKDKVVYIKDPGKDSSKDTTIKGFQFEISGKSAAQWNLGYASESYPLGYGGGLNLALRNVWFTGDFWGLFAGYFLFSGTKTPFETMNRMPLIGMIGYEKSLGNAGILLYLSGGMDFMTIKTKSDINDNSEDFRLPFFGAALQIRYYLYPAFFVSLEMSGSAQWDSELVPFAAAHLGLGYRL